MKGLITHILDVYLYSFEGKIRNIVLIISLMCFIGCAESIDFDIQKDELIVVDGKVSTETNESYVRIYKASSESDIKQDQSGYDVIILSSENEEIPFMESDTLPGRYIPSSSFRGEIGLEYRLKATSPLGLVLRSSNDRVPNPAPFEMILKESIEQETSSSGFLLTKKSIAILANIDTRNNDQYQSVFTFSYDYEHYFTNDSLTITDVNQFALFECALPGECEKENGLLVAEQVDISWFFYDPACGPFRGCFPASCCYRQNDWGTYFEVTQETMSSQTYKLWSDIEKLIGNNGLIFDTFPFAIEGNVSCENCDIKVLGNVRAVSVTKQKQLVFL
ncbi:MAG: DUF4249 family protein [Ekhidna sp.]